MKKKLTSFFAVVLVISLFISGCSGSGVDQTGTDNESNVTNDKSKSNNTQTNNSDGGSQYIEPLGKYDKVIDVHAVKSVTAEMTVETLTESIWINMYREEFGINLIYDWIATSEQYDQKVNLMMASGEMPDVMQVNFRQLNMLVEAGMLSDLTQVWNKCATDESKESMQHSNQAAFDMATFDGKLYGIPVTTPIEETSQVLWVRKDWIEKLDLKMPTTMDDLIYVMEAFATQDPDGNGVDDTFGMTLSKELYDPVHGLAPFANSYQAYPDSWNEDENGNLIYGSTQPEMKQVLSKLSDLYQSGLIDQEFIVKDMNVAGESITQEKAGVMYGMQWAPFIGPYALWPDNKNSDFQALPLLPSDDDKVLTQTYNNTSQFLVVRKDFEHPDVAAQFFNIWNRHLRGPHVRTFDEWWEYQAQLFDGSFVQPETGHWNAERWKLINKALETGDTSIFGDKHLIQELYVRLENFKNGDHEKEFDVPGCAMLFNCGEAFDVINNVYAKNNSFIIDKLGSYTSDNYIAKTAILDQLELETFTRIITGDLPVDEFDNFVKQWKELGGDEITQEINEWYKSTK